MPMETITVCKFSNILKRWNITWILLSISNYVTFVQKNNNNMFSGVKLRNILSLNNLSVQKKHVAC